MEQFNKRYNDENVGQVWKEMNARRAPIDDQPLPLVEAKLCGACQLSIGCRPYVICPFCRVDVHADCVAAHQNSCTLRAIQQARVDVARRASTAAGDTTHGVGWREVAERSANGSSASASGAGETISAECTQIANLAITTL